MAELDVRLLGEPPSTDVLEQRPGQEEEVEAEVALRERIESRLLGLHREARPSLDGAGFQEVVFNAGKQSLERPCASSEKRVCVPRLRRSRTKFRPLRQSVAVKHRHPVEVRRDRFSRCEAAHAGSDDNGMTSDRGRHQRISCWWAFSIEPAHCGSMHFRGRLPPEVHDKHRKRVRCDGDHTPDGPANGIRIHLAEAGRGSLVVLCHGFPESWYSWRTQLRALADAGFRAVAPDMRGYGQTDRPEEIEKYTLFHLVGDMVGLIDALGAEKAVIVGHDWGAPVAWHAGLLRPDRFRAVVGLSVPFRPRGPSRPTSAMPQTETALFYQLYFQEPGVAEAELERDPRDAIRRLLFSASGDAPRQPQGALEREAIGMVPRSGGFLTRMVAPERLPPWLTDADVDFYVAEYARTGFRGGLNWYRNIDRNWELMAPFAGLKVTVPALYVAGDRDLVVGFPGADRLIANLKSFVPELRATIMLAACGHWTQQERPTEVNAAILDFLRELE